MSIDSLQFTFFFVKFPLDCCDGSDEYDGTVICPNTCIMGGNVAYHHSVSYGSTIRRQSSDVVKSKKIGLNAEDSAEKLKGNSVIFIRAGFQLQTTSDDNHCSRDFRSEGIGDSTGHYCYNCSGD